ncbi:FtsX-like permease family protein [Brumicola blandensis]|uniref:FtsX-like permease family protein n=1 Tax=Brumicola blandensis TaxID=3075611 RepID=A0AAW8QXV4_9ALTE|nr:FtsX-like permease family protein [Alteromonas sp. W409]MDT0581344.1 FtsX-like permease family protein [Alteromonas sp. W409]
MFLALTIANRFRQSKQQSGFISFVSASSTIGIGLGCFVLILLLSVMNGFEKELRNTLLSYIPHAEFIAASEQGVYLDQETINKAQNDPRVRAVFSYTKASGLLQKGAKMKSVEIQGVDADYIKNKPAFALAPEVFATQSTGIYLGSGIVETLSIVPGDKVQLLLPSASADLSFQAPKAIWLEFLGEISLGGEVDDFVGIMDKQTLSSALKIESGASHIEFQLSDPFLGRQLIREYGYDFKQVVYMSDWTLTNGHLYQDIQLVRTVVYITLILVICVACFNIVSSLVMSVKEKTKEIAILKSMGAENKLLRQVFVIKGLINGLYGATVGTILGVLSAIYLVEISGFIETLFNFSLLGDGVYFINFIPSDLQLVDVIATYFLAIVLCVLATLYPAHKAANVDPATSLA